MDCVFTDLIGQIIKAKNNHVKIIRLSAKEALEGEWLRNVDPTG